MVRAEPTPQELLNPAELEWVHTTNCASAIPTGTTVHRARSHGGDFGSLLSWPRNAA